MSTASKLVVPSTSRSPLKSALPASVNVVAMSTAPSMSTTSRLVVPSTSKSPLKSALPASVSVVAMSTAPSMSTTSRLVVPSTSISPLISKDAKTEVPVPVTVPPTTTLPTTFIASKWALLNTFAATAPLPAPSKNTTAVLPAGIS